LDHRFLFGFCLRYAVLNKRAKHVFPRLFVRAKPFRYYPFGDPA
jgi:hypothetical protein